MFTHHRGRLAEVTPQVLGHWFLLSFMAGNINAGGFLACNRFVTHVTGFATIAGIDFATGGWRAGIGMLAVPLFFLLGVMVSAYCIDRRMNNGQLPRYPLVMGLVTGCLFLVAFGGYFRIFGFFDGTYQIRRDFLFMALLCMASGLTNAALTTSTGAFVRITHLTGIMTDLGIGVMRVAAMKNEHPDYRIERMANLYRAGNIVSFTVGSLAGALLFLQIQYLGFLLPAILSLYAVRLARASEPNAKKALANRESLFQSK